MSNQDPILSEQSLLWMMGGLMALIIMAGISFTIILRKDPKQVKAFRGGRILHYVTVLAVVFATILLALERILTGEAVSTILGGIIGYVLGTLKEREGTGNRQLTTEINEDNQ
jgi:hypothetical protein